MTNKRARKILALNYRNFLPNPSEIRQIQKNYYGSIFYRKKK